MAIFALGASSGMVIFVTGLNPGGKGKHSSGKQVITSAPYRYGSREHSCCVIYIPILASCPGLRSLAHYVKKITDAMAQDQPVSS